MKSLSTIINIKYIIFVTSIAVTVKHCQTLNHRSILRPSQLEILLDKSGTHLAGHIVQSGKFQYCCRPAKKSLSVSNLDITLLRCLLLNFAQNYNANPTLRKDIEDLVECRNKLYGHIQTATLSDTDYAKYKTDVEGIILRIARFCNIENEILQKLNDASQRPLDETILIQYQTTLMQQSERDKEIEEVSFLIFNIHLDLYTYFKFQIIIVIWVNRLTGNQSERPNIKYKKKLIARLTGFKKKSNNFFINVY